MKGIEFVEELKCFVGSMEIKRSWSFGRQNVCKTFRG